MADRGLSDPLPVRGVVPVTPVRGECNGSVIGCLCGLSAVDAEVAKQNGVCPLLDWGWSCGSSGRASAAAPCNQQCDEQE